MSDSAHTRGLVSIGVAGSLGPDAIGPVAAAVEEAGFHALWVNDTPQGDAIAGLAAAAAVTSTLVLATGVIPLDRKPPASVIDAVRTAGLPEDRLVLGVGSGRGRKGALARVRDGVAALREGTTAQVVVGALGPRMRELAATDADGVLLNWVTPDIAREQGSGIRSRSSGAARTVVYARTIVDADARANLDAQVALYDDIPQYAANFARLGVTAIDTVLPRPGDAGIGPGVHAYLEACDELVLRAITAGDDLDGHPAFVPVAAHELSAAGVLLGGAR